ncbi:MAG TPA: aldo/keto reductase [Planctomycetota bacterium]|nr:aldo/keto reductase [Planctomycetota bacterium]
MNYRRMGKSGLQLSELSLGSWITFNRQTDYAATRKIMHRAFDAGVNFFDNAEGYAAGAAESLMGEVLRDFRRSDIVVSTKIFHGGSGPNDTGLSWKHLIEGTHASLQRLKLESVDILFCHRPDPNTPVEETVRAMDVLIRQGKVFYWGTSEWSAAQIEEALRVARECNAAAPAVEQPQYNLLRRERVERELSPLFERSGLGTATWSPLASGLLTGKYEAGIPKGSRLDLIEWLRASRTDEALARARGVAKLAQRLGCSAAQLSIAWCLANPRVSSVILGVSRLEQLEENLGAIEVKQRLDPATMAELDSLCPLGKS